MAPLQDNVSYTEGDGEGGLHDADGSKHEDERKIHDDGIGEGEPRQKKRSNYNSNNKKKRSRLSDSKSRKRCIIPEAQVIQGYDECAYISDHEEEEREYLPLSRPSRNADFVDNRLQQDEDPRHEIRAEVLKNDAPLLFKYRNGGSRHHNGSRRCHCFDCLCLLNL